MIKNYLLEQAQNTKVATTVAAVTTSVGAGSILDFIPQDIAKLSTLIGAILATVMIVIHVRKEIREREEHRLKIEKLELENKLLRSKQ